MIGHQMAWLCRLCKGQCCHRHTKSIPPYYLFARKTANSLGMKTHTAKVSCPCLRDDGCMLPREHRPFPCTEYQCPVMVVIRNMGHEDLCAQYLRQVHDHRFTMGVSCDATCPMYATCPTLDRSRSMVYREEVSNAQTD